MPTLHHKDHRDNADELIYNYIVYLYTANADCLDSAKLRNLQALGANMALRVGYDAKYERPDVVPQDITIPMMTFADDTNGETVLK